MFSKTGSNDDAAVYAALKQNLIESDADHTGQLFYNAIKSSVELVPLLGSDKEYKI